MNDRTTQKLEEYLLNAEGLDSDANISNWARRVETFLELALGAEAAAEFRKLHAENAWDQFAIQRGHLEGLIARDDGSSNATILDGTPTPPGASHVAPLNIPTRKVFVVHGHDGEVKETVARFLEKLGLVPVILHEQPNQGRTIIEKFEVSSSDAAFAVVLLTPDDFGRSGTETLEMRPRARQNVILELGYFIGRLGRMRVCALHRGGVELPSDYQGVVYIEFDTAGAWRATLAQEFVEAKLSINVHALIQK